MTTLRAVGLGHGYSAPDGSRIEVLRDVTLEIEAGSLTLISGRSGAGKSTLLHLLGGLESPDEGHIQCEGVGTIGFVFQQFHLISHRTAWENLLLPFEQSGAGRVDTAQLRRLARRLGVEARLSHLPRDLSGGERQRVAIVRALARRPRLVLADEPTGALDDANADEVAGLLAELAREEGVAIVVASHDVPRYEVVVDHHWILEHGRLSAGSLPKQKPPRSPTETVANSTFTTDTPSYRGGWFRAVVAEAMSHRLRSALVVAAVAISLASLTALIGSGEATRELVQHRTEALVGRAGTVTFEVSARRDGAGLGPYLFADDHAALRRAARSAGAIAYSPIVTLQPSTVQLVRTGGVSVPTAFFGVGEDIFDIRRLELTAGRRLTGQDIAQARPVAIVNEETAARLGLQAKTLVGQRVHSARHTERELIVVGVVDSGLIDEPIGFVPWTTVEKSGAFGSSANTAVSVVASQSDSSAGAVGAAMLAAFEGRGDGRTLRLRAAEVDEASLERVVAAVQLFLGFAAGVGLLVGALGLANVLFLSVNERTREIGIRRAFGASARDIQRLFLAEAALLALAGGVTGLWTAGVLLRTASGVADVLLRSEGFHAGFPMRAAWLGLVGIVIVGLAAGWAPARRAARLPVVKALRGE